MSEQTGPSRPLPDGGERSRAPSGQGGERRAAPRRRVRRRPLIVTLLIRVLQLIGTLILIGAVTGSFLLCYAALYVKNVVMPKTELDLSSYILPENSVIYYQDKNTGMYRELITLVGEKNSELVKLEDIPDDLINAVIAIEDKRFRSHHGVDWKRTGGAVVNMFFGMSNTYGGSTITQQLIKNLTEYDDVTVTRKIQEIFTALELEKKYTKEQILEVYLNRIYMGSGCYGVQSASKKYFGKDVSELSLAECASLAGITNNPALYGPNSDIRVTRFKCRECGDYTNANTAPEVCPDCGAKRSFGAAEVWTAKDYNKRRQQIILKQMLGNEESAEEEEKGFVAGLIDWAAERVLGPDEDKSYITRREYDAALRETLHFEDYYGFEDGDGEIQESRYSWYVETVIAEVKKDLRAKTQLDLRAVNQLLYSGGLSIYTNYDPEVQAAVDAVYSDAGNLENKTSNDGYPIKSAITVVDNSTGLVVAIAGDLGEKKGDLINNYATLLHQPGSSFKPLSVYAPAVEMNLIYPGTVMDDNPLELDGNPWPRNEGNPWTGLMTVKEGLGKSLNTIAVRTLDMVTPAVSFQFLQERFGITSLESGREVRGGWKSDIDRSPLAMGGLTDGVSTFEMAAAFASFPRGGTYTEPTTYLKIEDRSHAVLIDNTPQSWEAVSARTAYYMNTMLTNAVTWHEGTGTPAYIKGMTVGGKTGTTQRSFDRWFCGFTPYYTAAVWVGYEYDREITGFKGFTHSPATRLWRMVMEQLVDGKEDPGLPRPADLKTVQVRICNDCGRLADIGCENDSRGSRAVACEYVVGDEPTELCFCHVPVEVCTDSPILNENGEETGYWHRAGANCPEESRRTIYYVNYQRVLTVDPWTITDYNALKSTYDLYNGEEGVCTVHTEGQGPLDPFDPNFPYDPFDPSTWPDDIWPWPSRDPASSGEPQESTWPSWPWASDAPVISPPPTVQPGVEIPTLPPVPEPAPTESQGFIIPLPVDPYVTP